MSCLVQLSGTMTAGRWHKIPTSCHRAQVYVVELSALPREASKQLFETELIQYIYEQNISKRGDLSECN
jgi:hypothetical protein